MLQRHRRPCRLKFQMVTCTPLHRTLPKKISTPVVAPAPGTGTDLYQRRRKSLRVNAACMLVDLTTLLSPGRLTMLSQARSSQPLDILRVTRQCSQPKIPPFHRVLLSMLPPDLNLLSWSLSRYPQQLRFYTVFRSSEQNYHVQGFYDAPYVATCWSRTNSDAEGCTGGQGVAGH
jgi:hypothetical protein